MSKVTANKSAKLLSDKDILDLLAEASRQLEAYVALAETSNLKSITTFTPDRPKDWSHPIGLSFIKGV